MFQLILGTWICWVYTGKITFSINCCRLGSNTGLPSFRDSSQEGHSIWNYIDDLLCVSLPSKIGKLFTRLQRLLEELGLSISVKKLVPSSTRVRCPDIQVDTDNLSISIPAKKLQTINQKGITIVLYCIVYLYSAQYLHILQDSKRYLANPTVQVQPQLTSN